MANSCKLTLYNGNSSADHGDLYLALKMAAKGDNQLLINFAKRFCNEDINIKTLSNDDKSQLQLSAVSLKQDTETLLQRIYGKKQSVTRTKLNKTINDLFKFTESVNEQPEIKDTLTSIEQFEKNRKQLNDYVSDFYGTNVTNMIRDFSESFKENVVTSIYFNPVLGLCSQSNDIALNKNIRIVKGRYYQKIKDYLVRNYPETQTTLDTFGIDGLYNSKVSPIVAYNVVMGLFYKNVVSRDDFKDNLSRSYQAKRVRTDDQLIAATQLCEILKDDQKFRHQFRGGQYLSRKEQNDLRGGRLLGRSLYYKVEQYIESTKDLPANVKELWGRVQGNNLIDAANAYMALFYFDDLLKNSFGNQISIKYEGLMTDANDKYSFTQGSNHQRQSWNTEDNNSDKFTSEFSKTILSAIKVYNAKTGEYMNRHVSFNEFMASMGWLINGILNGNISYGEDPEIYDNAANLLGNPTQCLVNLLTAIFKRNPNGLPSKNGIFEPKYWDTIKSVYDQVLSPAPDHKGSLYNQRETRDLARKICDDIAGLVCDNHSNDYLITEPDQRGTNTPYVHKKYFYNGVPHRISVAINNFVSNLNDKQCQNLVRKYKFKAIDGGYSITLGDQEIHVRFSNANTLELFDPDREGNRIIIDDNGFFDGFNSIDGSELYSDLEKRKKISTTLPKGKLSLVLNFIADTLGFDFKSESGCDILDEFRVLHLNSKRNTPFVVPLVKMAFKSMYVADVRSKQVNEGKDTLLDYLESSNNNLFYAQKELPARKILQVRGKSVNFFITYQSDPTTQMLGEATQRYRGEEFASTTKNLFGDRIANNIVSSLGNKLVFWLNSQHKDYESPSSRLMFAVNPHLIAGSVEDIDIRINGIKRSVKSLKANEILHHAIFDKFFGKLIESNGNSIIVQPAVVADKTRFINYIVNLDASAIPYTNINAMQNQWNETVGAYYVQVQNDVANRLTMVCNQLGHVNEDYHDVLPLYTEEQLINAARRAGVALQMNLDYYVDRNGHTHVNPNVDYMVTIFGQNNVNDKEKPERRKAYFQNIEDSFIRSLVNANCSFKAFDQGRRISDYDVKANGMQIRGNSVVNAIQYLYKRDPNALDGLTRNKYCEEWIDKTTGMLIIAKDGKKNIMSKRDLSPSSKNLKLNPLLRMYMYADGLISKNLLISLTGSELNHPSKRNSPFNFVKNNENAFNAFVKEHNLKTGEIATARVLIDGSFDEGDLMRKVQNEKNQNVRNALNALLDDSFKYRLSTAQNAQTKRNVPITASLHYCKQGIKGGVPPVIKVAVIHDRKAPVWNQNGATDSIEANDGSAYVTPYMAIMMNRALGTQAVGIFSQKPIWHAHMDGFAFLAKYATFNMMNESMSLSNGSDVRLYDIFKKATNLQWMGNVNLMESDALSGIFGNFKRDGETGKTIVYKDTRSNILWQITGLKATDDGIYYTWEKNFNEERGKFRRVYHVFSKGESKHIATENVDEARNLIAQHGYHRINSIFELHAALGGIYCIDPSTGQTSEYNNEIITDFITSDEEIMRNHIGSVMNETSVKCGIRNINPESRWTDNEPLNYFQVESYGLGMQQNTERSAIDEDVAEASQAMRSAVSNGYAYNEAKELIQSLAKSAIADSKELTDAIRNFNLDKDEKTLDKLYDVIGKIIINGDRASNYETLKSTIVQYVKKYFKRNNKHIGSDEILLPFSEASLYNDFVNNISDALTSAIKRRHSGSNDVLVPSYGVAQYYELDGQPYLFDDIVELAKDDYKQALINILRENGDIDPINAALDINTLVRKCRNLNIDPNIDGYSILERDQVDFNRKLVSNYLNKQINRAELRSGDYFIPSDVIDVIQVDKNGNRSFVGEPIKLDSLDAFYQFKDRLANGEFSGYRFIASVRAPRDLRPSIIRWQVNGRWMSWFDLAHIRKSHYNGVDPNSLEFRQMSQKCSMCLHEGFLPDENGNAILDENGNPYRISNLENEAAENMVGNAYRDTFDIKPNMSLRDVTPEYFESVIKTVSPPVSSNFEIAFLRANGKHGLITFGSLTGVDCKEDPFNRTAEDDDGNIVIKSNGRTAFRIGKWIDVSNTIKINEKGDYCDISTGTTIDNNSNEYRTKDGQVQRRINFVERYKTYIESVANDGSRINKSYTLLHIADLSQFELAGEQNAQEARAIVISDIYKSNRYLRAQVNFAGSNLENNENAATLQAVIDNISETTDNTEIKNYYQAQKNGINASLANDKTKIDQAIIDSSNILTNINKRLAQEKFSSFQLSLSNVCSRIPGQSLASFMAMKTVGWIAFGSNNIYVSRFQTYLQGSDYDIDKSNTLGSEFDSQGKYVGWNEYFDYTSAKTLEASMHMPIPKGLEIVSDSKGIDISNESKVLSRTPTTENERVEWINNLTSALRKAESTRGRVKGATQNVLTILNNCQKEPDVPSLAYRNAATANLFFISQDLRNRERGYTATTIETLNRLAAERENNESLMDNPARKYVDQVSNMEGKNGVGIAANGNKFAQNEAYYWQKTVREGGDIKKLKYNIVLNRVLGRTKGEIKSITLNAIPDIDPETMSMLSKLDKTITSRVAYAAELMSQYISAATDNVKNPVLGLINAGPDLLAMHLFLISRGMSAEDTIAFMTSPIADFISGRIGINMYNPSGNGSVYDIINEATGEVNTANLLSGHELDENGIAINKAADAKSAIKEILYDDKLKKFPQLEKAIENSLVNEQNDKRKTIDDVIDNCTTRELMQVIIQTCVAEENEKLTSVIFTEGYTDSDLNKASADYFRYCRDLIMNLRSVVADYMAQYNLKRSDAVKALFDDAEEFKYIKSLADEMTNITTSILGLNQRLPHGEEEIVKKIVSLRRLITNREMFYGIDADTLFNSEGEIEDSTVIDKIKQYNLHLTDEEIVRRLKRAAEPGENEEHGIISHFDPVEMLRNSDYRERAIDYLDLIKGFANGINMAYTVDDYAVNMNLLSDAIQGDRALSIKSRMIGQALSEEGSLMEEAIKGISKLSDDYLVMGFLKDLGSIHVDGDNLTTFSPEFKEVPLTNNTFNLGTVNDIAGFRRFIETDFIDQLLNDERTKDNLFIKGRKHLQYEMDPQSGMTVLRTDIDLTHHDETESSRKSYDEITQGLKELQDVPYDNSGLSVADMFMLYNLIVNSNRNGAATITAAFTECNDKNNVFIKYFNYISKLDVSGENMNFDTRDVGVASAQVVPQYMLSRLRGKQGYKWVYVNDPINGIILYQWKSDNAKYKQNGYYGEYNILSAGRGTTISKSSVEYDNFMRYCPFKYPSLMSNQRFDQAFGKEGSAENIANILADLITSNKLYIIKANC